MKELSLKLRYSNFIIVPVLGYAGRLALLWNSNIDLVMKWSNDWVICLSVADLEGRKALKLFYCYGIPYFKEKKFFFEDSGFDGYAGKVTLGGG
ncbi:hypothetical protein FNV43_RR11183 [Rhamnella rubrinervis]|uniref:Uncharacterized protein n=1 Tax=Rhamnella rubrinervis TaxID=2594499 RepID=A0A8K0H5C7_9ROSA|nr:hypothetical protein FNV43_RR11183 [Rhamnella rubrinervis]